MDCHMVVHGDQTFDARRKKWCFGFEIQSEWREEGLGPSG